MGVLVTGTLRSITSIGQFQMIANIFTEMINCIETDVFINVARHTTVSIEEIHKVRMDGKACSIPHGISNFLAHAVESIRKVVGEART